MPQGGSTSPFWFSLFASEISSSKLVRGMINECTLFFSPWAKLLATTASSNNWTSRLTSNASCSLISVLPLHQHSHSGPPLPQHSDWDGGQQTRSPQENTNRSIHSSKNQITPPFISTLVFHLLPESYPSLPLLSPAWQTKPLTPPAIFINMSNKALTSDLEAQSETEVTQVGVALYDRTTHNWMTVMTQSNCVLSTGRTICCRGWDKAMGRVKWFKTIFVFTGSHSLKRQETKDYWHDAVNISFIEFHSSNKCIQLSTIQYYQIYMADDAQCHIRFDRSASFSSLHFFFLLSESIIKP